MTDKPNLLTEAGRQTLSTRLASLTLQLQKLQAQPDSEACTREIAELQAQIDRTAEALADDGSEQRSKA